MCVKYCTRICIVLLLFTKEIYKLKAQVVAAQAKEISSGVCDARSA